MSLGDVTECDLCYDKAKLDLDAILKVAEHDFFVTILDLRQDLSALEYPWAGKKKKDLVSSFVSHVGKTAEHKIKHLRVSAEVLDALYDAGNRENIEIIRRNEN